MNKREEEKLKKQQEKLQKELERTEAMSVYEEEYSDCTYICGIDERGLLFCQETAKSCI